MNIHKKTGMILFCLESDGVLNPFRQQTGSSRSSSGGFNPSSVARQFADPADVAFHISVDESNVG